MDFGAEFDDDVFERPKEKRPKSPITQGARVVAPQWFLEPDDVTDSEEILQRCRHKADYQYFTKDYSQASVTYEHCLRLLPASNISCRRDCMENLSRSLLHIGSAEKALEWALKMHAAAVNYDQKIVSLNLLATICHALGKYEEELEALHSCLEPHKNNPDLWLRLAFCYAGMFKIDLLDSKRKLHSVPYCCAFNSRISNHSRCESTLEQFSNNTEMDGHVEDSISSECQDIACHSTSRKDSQDLNPMNMSQESVEKCEMCTLGVQMVSACLLRARLLMSSSEKNHFNTEKYNQIDEKITKCLNHMEVEQPFIDEASKMLKSEAFSGLPLNKEIPSVT